MFGPIHVYYYCTVVCVLLFTKGSDDRCDKENMYVLLFTKGSDDRCGEAVCDDHCEYDQMPGILDPIQKVPVSCLHSITYSTHHRKHGYCSEKRDRKR